MAFLQRVLRDRLFRRFLVACGFAGAFVWVAIDAFGVSEEVILEFFLLSVLLVLGMVVVALPFALLIRLLRRRRADLSFETSLVERQDDREPKP